MTFLSILTALLITAPAETPQTIRIATYNIHHAAGTDGVVDVHRIAQLIEAMEADIVCLQEVDQHVKRSKNLDIPNMLADKLDMHVVYGPNLDLGEGKYGNAILSRFPFISSENIALPNPLNKEPRGCQRANIDLGDNNTLTVYNTHLGLNKTERLAQAKHIVYDMKGNNPLILAGDLNAVVGEESITTFLSRVVDSPTAMVSPTAQIPLEHPSHNTIPTVNPKKRIDYIMNAGLDCHMYSVYHFSQARVASDHLPVVADFSLPTIK